MKSNAITLNLHNKNTMTRQVLIAMLAAGLTKFDAEIFYFEAMNALDVDYYSPGEIRDLFNKLKKTMTVEDAKKKSQETDFTKF